MNASEPNHSPRHFVVELATVTPLVSSSSLQVKVVGPEMIEGRVMVEAAAFPGSSLSVDRWRQMASGHVHPNAKCLVGYDEDRAAVAATTVWSAGRVRPGASNRWASMVVIVGEGTVLR